jgi:hypothetical protein
MKDVELRLNRKKKMTEKQMKMVGGFLTFSYGEEYLNADLFTYICIFMYMYIRYTYIYVYKYVYMLE